MSQTYDYADCLDHGDGPCAGEITLSASLTGATSNVRCDTHYDAYVRRTQPKLDAINERYPDSPFAPDWFDPAYAGESWDEEW